MHSLNPKILRESRNATHRRVRDPAEGAAALQLQVDGRAVLGDLAAQRRILRCRKRKGRLETALLMSIDLWCGLGVQQGVLLETERLTLDAAVCEYATRCCSRLAGN